MSVTLSLPTTAPGAQSPTSLIPAGRATLLAPFLVFCVGTVLAGMAYVRFLEIAPQLWTSGIHDRNAHYWLGLGFALDLRQGNLLNFVHDLHSARMWTPLHALLLGAVLAIGGLDYRLAVLPSLTAWVLSAVFAFLAARRAVRQGGNLAGFTAALFVLASPAHQAFGTDIMLESLGACLTLAVLYAWQVALQERTVWSGRLLGLALTLLFFDKYNYWLLVVLGLIAATVLAHPRQSWQILRDLVRETSWKGWLLIQLRHPLTYLLAPLFVLLTLAYTHEGPIQIGGWKFFTNPPHNVAHIAFVLLVLRLWPWWRRSGRFLARGLGVPARQLIGWHLFPVIVWFLWPQRLGYCLWYLTRNHGADPAVAVRYHGKLGYYLAVLRGDYHQSALAALLVVGLFGMAFISWRRLRPGAAAVLCFTLLAALLTLNHPSPRSRFLHSWIAVGWVGTGIGLAQLVYTRRSALLPRIRPWLGAVALAGLGLLQFPGMLEAGHAPEGGGRLDQPNLLALTDAYLPLLEGARRPAIFANLPARFLTSWTWRERRHEHLDPVCEVKGFGSTPAEDRRVFEAWLQNTPCDAVVLIDFSPASANYDPAGFPDYRIIRSSIEADVRFKRVGYREAPGCGCSAIVWRRCAESVR